MKHLSVLALVSLLMLCGCLVEIGSETLVLNTADETITVPAGAIAGDLMRLEISGDICGITVPWDWQDWTVVDHGHSRIVFAKLNEGETDVRVTYQRCYGSDPSVAILTVYRVEAP